MADFLVFQLYGAMASWGDIAVGEHRPSLGHPTKSAVTGLLAAALGIERDKHEAQTALAEHYASAVCVYAGGEVLRDYHTVQVPSGKRNYASRRDELRLDQHNLNTLLSQRDYRTDALYQIAVWTKDPAAPYSLEDVQQALRRPRFPLYLGRKACPPGLPLNPQRLNVPTLRQAFADYPLDSAQPWVKYLGQDQLLRYYWEADSLAEAELGLTATLRYPRRDHPGDRRRWQFSPREENYAAAPQGDR